MVWYPSYSQQFPLVQKTGWANCNRLSHMGWAFCNDTFRNAEETAHFKSSTGESTDAIPPSTTGWVSMAEWRCLWFHLLNPQAEEVNQNYSWSIFIYFFDSHSPKQLQTWTLCSSCPQRPTWQVWRRSDARLSRYAEDRQTDRFCLWMFSFCYISDS